MSATPYLKPTSALDRREMGKYEVLCRLSTGGMSEIFLAHQKGLAGFRKLVVLKSILPDIRGEEDFVRMFLDEAKTTALFNHPNIAQVFDLDVDKDTLFLAMEFVEGCTLVEMARACRQAKEPIPIGFTLQAVRDTALALHYAHNFTDPRGRKKTVIHRDVAEKNIMVSYDGTTKLLDFGIAKALGHQAAGRTSVGMVKGTSGYMSPEQIRGEPLDARSDVFSLGVVLHECLTAMRLFHGKTPEEAMLAALREEIPPPSRQNAEVSEAIDQVTLKALERDRDSRYSTALEFARAIEKAAGGLIWLPEKSGELVSRHFADRREQTRALMVEVSGEQTGEVRINHLLEAIQGGRGEELRPTATPPRPAPAPAPPPAAAPAPKGPVVSQTLSAPPQRRSNNVRTIGNAETPKALPAVREETVTKSGVTEPTGPNDLSALRPSSTRDESDLTPSDGSVIKVNPSEERTKLLPPDYDERDDDPGLKTVPAAQLPNGMYVPPEPPSVNMSPPTPLQRPSRPGVSTISDGVQPRQSRPALQSLPPPPPVPSAPRPSTYDDDIEDDPDVKTTIARPFEQQHPGANDGGARSVAPFVAIGAAAALLVVTGLLWLLHIGPFAPSTPGPKSGQSQKTASGKPPRPVIETIEAKPADVKAVDTKPAKLEPPSTAAAKPEPTEPAPAPKQPAPRPAEVKLQPPPAPRPVAVAVKPAPVRTSPKPKDDEPGEPASSGAPGKLTLVTDPPGLMVIASGQELGSTPLFNKELPAGKVTLKLINAQQQTKSLVVDIRAGQLTSLRQEFESLK